MDAPRLGRGDPLPGAIAEVGALPLGEDQEELHAGAARGRGRVDRLLERDQAGPRVLDPLDEPDPVEKGPGDAVEVLDQDDVDPAPVDQVEELEELRSAKRGAGTDLDELADARAWPARRGHRAEPLNLRGEVVALGVGGYAGVEGNAHGSSGGSAPFHGT